MTALSLRRSALLGGGLGLLGACVVPTFTCACPPARTHGVARGTVRTAAGAPVANAEIHAELRWQGCAESAVEIGPAPGFRPLSDAAGAYELHFFSTSASGEACVRLAAVRPAGDTAFATVESFPLVTETRTAPGRQIDIVFP